jgi:general stress protein YciG
MSNDNRNADMNDRGSSIKNDPNQRSVAAQKTGQQSQDASRHQQDATHHPIDKSPQQGGADKKSGQQLQGGSQKDNCDMKQSGSGNITHDQKHASEAGQKSGAFK